MEQGCTECSKVRETEYHERNKLILHTSARLVFGPSKSEKKKSEWKETGKEWKKERDGFVRQLKQRVSALRNSRGGILFVHINDLNPADRCLDLFHELVDNRLNDMIEDGSLFVTIYKKDWLSEEDEENNGFVAITVSPSQSIVTLDYKTKIPLDNSIEDPTSSTILKILSHGLKLKKRDAKIRGLEYKKLRENRHVQVKALFYNNRNTADINSFVKYLWEVLRLREYITSFSKVDGGGSIYIGIQEEEKHYDTYTTRQLVQTGFQVKFGESEIIEALKAKVKDETIVLIKDTDKVRFSNAENLVDAVFHPLPHARGFHVLEVAVAAVAGLVFFDSDGPEAYEINEISSDKIKRIPCADWYKRLVSPLKKRSIGIQVNGRN